jgi:hypothetical protein
MPDNDVVLPVQCSICERPFSVLYQRDPQAPTTEKTFFCPHPDCHGTSVQRVRISGQILDIWTGHPKAAGGD